MKLTGSKITLTALEDIANSDHRPDVIVARQMLAEYHHKKYWSEAEWTRIAKLLCPYRGRGR